jgi:hypothetical protein
MISGFYGPHIYWSFDDLPICISSVIWIPDFWHFDYHSSMIVLSNVISMSNWSLTMISIISTISLSVVPIMGIRSDHDIRLTPLYIRCKS